ncbi:MAG TPA: hypothetical protein VN788_11320 [Verrucomicrobiae bacterium]|nr:hypothetical protein [Verrucomicrobiae bacterium]
MSRIIAQLMIVVFVAAVSSVSVSAQGTAKPMVWTDPTNQYANYLEAAVLKKHTPVTFTTEKASASYIATLDAEAQKGSAARAIFLGAANSGAKSNLSLTVSDAKTGAVVFSYTCQKNGEFGSFQSASECLAKHWTHFMAKGKP